MTKRIIVVTVVLLVACGTPRGQAGAQTTLFPTSTLDQVLAPIALYPDQLLAQMLISATEPAKITELDKWMKSNATLKGTQLQDAAVKAGFDASFVALVIFPDVIAKMAEQIAWTTVLGQSFTKDKSAVFASIQGLRAKARNVGTLKDSAQQNVETKTTSSGQDVIVIEPANPQVIYVPQYNPTVVYTQPPTTTTVVVQEDNDSSEAVAAGLIGFTAGIAIGAAMDNNYYYGPCCMYRGAYMYNDAWDDYYDHREDAREDWMDHREDVIEDRGERRENTQEQRTDRAENRQENRPDSAQRSERAAQAQAGVQQRQAQGGTQRTAQGASATTQTQQRTRSGTPQERGYGDGSGATAVQQRSGSSDAFSGYSSGSSQRATSSRGQASRGSSSRSRSGGGGGGGRRR